ncbi:hypothetical protein POM88_012548 [Heracleum sosnowskyi]|uniref:Uncharacterized protein n=1 Tax=Heracleum sosnowskyi TaxID=360622 RepID=A0AAD8J045_9APIA|nr:hypothetical protein POM88_012548 [Heracleum sosnowskyi]
MLDLNINDTAQTSTSDACISTVINGSPASNACSFELVTRQLFLVSRVETENTSRELDVESQWLNLSVVSEPSDNREFTRGGARKATEVVAEELEEVVSGLDCGRIWLRMRKKMNLNRGGLLHEDGGDLNEEGGAVTASIDGGDRRW